MLVLSRKQNQTILIGDRIVVRICNIKGSTVRLGIEAPADVNILRGELACCQSANQIGQVINEIPHQDSQIQTDSSSL